MNTSIRPRNRAVSRGFTLVELLAVLVILSVLAYFLMNNLRGGTDAVKSGVTKNRLAQIGAMLGEFSDAHGDFPKSQLAQEFGVAPNATNVGAECLYLALCAQGERGNGTLDKVEMLSNTDRDALSKRPKGFETQDLYEICDSWGSPIAYIHHSDYEREFQYVTGDTETGAEFEASLRARKNAKTGRYEMPHGFQLVSAGADLQFGTDDDIANYEK